MNYVQVRNEEMSAFTACAHSKFTGEVGVCLATSGPGAVHLLNGLYDAGGKDGLDYSYADVATGKLIQSLLSDVVNRRNAFDIPGAHASMVRKIRHRIDGDFGG